jgi:uncharacterized paraquat-inducible protein A
MSSATSTDSVRLQPDTPNKRSVRLQADGDPGAPADRGLQPWQFFVLAALISATGVTYMVRGQGVTTVLLLSVLMLTTASVGLAVLRTVRPLVTKQEDRTPMVGDRTRAALEREKMLALRTLKELEFDRSMTKISEDDYREMSTRLRARATRIMGQLDAGAGYRAKIEADLAKRLERVEPETKARAQARTCAACQTVNDVDAKFCKGCGQKL